MTLASRWKWNASLNWLQMHWGDNTRPRHLYQIGSLRRWWGDVLVTPPFFFFSSSLITRGNPSDLDCRDGSDEPAPMSILQNNSSYLTGHEKKKTHTCRFIFFFNIFIRSSLIVARSHESRQLYEDERSTRRWKEDAAPGLPMYYHSP